MRQPGRCRVWQPVPVHIVYRLADALGLRDAPLPTTFLTHAAIRRIARAAGYEVVHSRAAVRWPFALSGLRSWIVRLLARIP